MSRYMDSASVISAVRNHIDKLNSDIDAFNDQLDEKDVEINRLRKIASHVPGRIYIEAKEKAGFPDFVQPEQQK